MYPQEEAVNQVSMYPEEEAINQVSMSRQMAVNEVGM